MTFNHNEHADKIATEESKRLMALATTPMEKLSIENMTTEQLVKSAFNYFTNMRRASREAFKTGIGRRYVLTAKPIHRYVTGDHPRLSTEDKE